MTSSRFRLAAVVLLVALATMIVPTRAQADPVTTQATCHATEPMVGRGSVTMQVKVGTITVPVTIQVPEIGDSISDALSTTDLPVPLPTDIDAPASISSGSTVNYAGDIDIDLGAQIDDVMDPIRQQISDAGYPDLATTLTAHVAAENIEIPFVLPDGTSPTGTPSATGTGASAAFDGNTMVLGIDSFAFDTDDGSDPVQSTVTWSAAHSGDVSDSPLELRLGTTTFDLDLDVSGSVPGDLVRPLVPAQYQSLVPDVVPVTGGASGPWSCTPDAPVPAIASTLVTAPCDSGFTDVPLDHPFCSDIEWFAGEGLTTGYSDGSYRPAAPVTRQAIAAMFYRAAGEPTVPVDAPTFTDVPADHPFVDAIRWLASEEVTTGYSDGTFRPSATISRQAIAAMFYRSSDQPTVPVDAPTFTDVPADHPFADAIRWLASEEITTGYPDGTFKPQANVTRQSTAAFFHRWMV